MKKKGFTLIELLIVIAIIGILSGAGGYALKSQAEAKAMLRVQNGIGDFFRVAARRSLETRERYLINFNLSEKKIEISKDGKITDSLKLPNNFEYEKISETTREQIFTRNITSTGNLSRGFTLYVFKSNSEVGIQGDEIAKHAITFNTTNKHVRFLQIKEYTPIEQIRAGEINPGSSSSKDVSKAIFWKKTRD